MNNKREEIKQLAKEFINNSPLFKFGIMDDEVPQIMVDFAKQWIELAEERGKILVTQNELYNEVLDQLKAKDKEIGELEDEHTFYQLYKLALKNLEQSQQEVKRLKEGVKELIKDATN